MHMPEDQTRRSTAQAAETTDATARKEHDACTQPMGSVENHHMERDAKDDDHDSDTTELSF